MVAKKTTAVAAMILASLAVTAATVHADENETREQNGRGQEMRQGGMRPETTGSGSEGRRGGWIIEEYLRTDLAKTDMEALKTVLDQHRESMKKLGDSLKAGTIAQAEFEVQTKALRDSHVTLVSQYVAADKLEAFKTALSATPLLPTKDGREKMKNETRGNMKNGSGGVSGEANHTAPEIRQAKLLPASIAAKIDARLAELTTDAARSEWLSAVIAKVEVLEAKAKSKKTKSLFVELKDLLSEKLDAVDGVSAELDSLNGLIQ